MSLSGTGVTRLLDYQLPWLITHYLLMNIGGFQISLYRNFVTISSMRPM